MQVEFVEQMSPIDKQDAVRNVAVELQKFFDEHHNKDGNMPEQAGDCEADGGVSDATPTSGPVRKRMRTTSELDSPAE